MDAIFFVLRTGCQWNALRETGICSSSSAHRRFQEWVAAGVFAAFWREVQGVIAAWSAEFGQAETRALVGVLRDHLIVGAAEHAEQVQDIDHSDAAAVRQAERGLAALEAARDALVAGYEALAAAEEMGVQ